MKRTKLIQTIAAVCAAMMLAALLGACGSTGAKNSAEAHSEELQKAVEAAMEDLLSESRVFMIYDQDGLKEYMTVTYGQDTHKLIALTDEIRFDVSAGYSMELVQDLDTSDSFPSFAVVTYEEKNDTIRLRAQMDGLDQPERIRELVDIGTLVLDEDYTDGSYVDADTVMQNFRDSGMPEMSLVEFGIQDLEVPQLDVVEVN